MRGLLRGVRPAAVCANDSSTYSIFLSLSLRFLTYAIQQAKRILEVGMFTGTSTTALALLPSVERVVPLEIEPYLKEFCTPWWKKAGVSDKVDCRIGDGQASLKQLAEEKATFDLVGSSQGSLRLAVHTLSQVFIDADKGGYRAYYDLVLSLNLLAPGGLIIADNTTYKACVRRNSTLCILPT